MYCSSEVLVTLERVICSNIKLLVYFALEEEFKIFVQKFFYGPGYPRKFLDGSTFPGLVILNETTHAKSMNSLHAVFMATMQLLANY